MALITCKDLVLSYEGQVVVEDLSFAVHAGDYLCIVGENGSGKSTLMKSILGLKTVNKGSITFGDQLKQNQIGYLPQQTTLQRDFPASVFEVTLSGCLNRRGWRPYYNRAEKYRAEDNLHRMGVAELKKKCYRELSGGQQQRVLLARALCATEKLLLLDEPVAGLDPMATAEFYKIISSLNKEGITIIMVSHDIRAAIDQASHILHLRHRPLFFGTAKDYVNSPAGQEFLKGGHSHA